MVLLRIFQNLRTDNRKIAIHVSITPKIILKVRELGGAVVGDGRNRSPWTQFSVLRTSYVSLLFFES